MKLIEGFKQFGEKMDYFFIGITIFFTVYGQLILKWRISKMGSFPDLLPDRIKFFVACFLDPFVLSGFLAAFLASVTWMAAMTKFELSYAYPFMSLNFVLVLLFGVAFLGESFTYPKAFGVCLIVVGTIIAARSA